MIVVIVPHQKSGSSDYRFYIVACCQVFLDRKQEALRFYFDFCNKKIELQSLSIWCDLHYYRKDAEGCLAILFSQLSFYNRCRQCQSH